MILENLSDIILAVAVMSLPLAALIGGVVVAIIKLIGRQRLEELASRERIAALERGVHPSQLPGGGGI